MLLANIVFIARAVTRAYHYTFTELGSIHGDKREMLTFCLVDMGIIVIINGSVNTYYST